MRHIDMAVYTNQHVVQAISMPGGPARDYKLRGMGVIFEIDQRLRDSFKYAISTPELIGLIQKQFKGASHTLDTCEMGYLNFGSLPICWHITTVNKTSGVYEKHRYLEECGKHLAFKLTVYRATDFAKIESRLIETRGFYER